ncbi:mannose-1-phosphate guanylyltransferase/mannose-6-phosphate isomerase [Alphaproteobacteria bacterium]|nr:mannose-1-phosphate guanylyltransferase/mannose-6-phosphate isomerase [Alphaproteobacteria bacterium]
MNIKPVILCGGAGSRLWPISRESFPKQFIPFFKNKTLFDLTIERALDLQKALNPIIVVSKRYEFLVLDTFVKHKIKPQLILEPIGKNTTAAIYLAARQSNENENLLIMPSDHIISDIENFKKAINDGVEIIKNNILTWVTFGVNPTYPSEAYGYIKVKKDNPLENKVGFSVSNFFEKPDMINAIKMLQEGGYFWNSGIFLANSNTIINSIKKYAPLIADACDLVLDKSDFSVPGRLNIDLESFKLVPSISIDYAIMEKEQNIKLMPIGSSWSDVGSWDTFAEVEKQIESENNFDIEGKNNFVYSKDKIVATIGIEDTIIINTSDATLVAKRGKSEHVKEIVQNLHLKNRVEGVEHDFEYRPWGYFKNIYNSKLYKVKYLLVRPKKRLSLQYHKKRSEHWVIVEGLATIHLNGKIKSLKVGESIDVPVLSEHYIANDEKINLVLIEIQMGTYFGEDDIVRLDDPYKR